ncbi:MAG: GGDEF domain-containing protein [Rhodanobacteraceae bacterium]|nr:GGDEF domain-containing protein [Xanthomonadales bacterium]MCP5477827.1 GGDEF domain-containing protein [Rhodanobacteraceae bacterium]HPF72742.1 diguanylate cyclase [Xanthomonadaceae bacterium]HRX99718.1 diguanylate cyclase [Xanthomonadaceae bacterium]
MQRRFPRILGLFLLALTTLVAFHALAQSEAGPGVMTVSSFSTINGGADDTKILDGEFDDQFLPVAGAIQLRGGSEYTHWLKLTPNPEAVAGDNGWRLRLERLPLDRLSLYLPRPGQRPESRYLSFYYPNEQDGVLANGFVFELPDPLPASMYLAIDTRIDLSVTPSLLVDRQYHVDERRLASLYGAVYAAIIVLVLGSLALFLALHERAYLHFVGVSASLVVLLAALNGHLFAIPVLKLTAWFGPGGVGGLMILFAALALGFGRYFLRLAEHIPGLARQLRHVEWALLALVALSLFGIDVLHGWLFRIGSLLWPLASLAVAILGFMAWRRGQRGALAFGLIWLGMAIAAGMRIAVMQAWFDSVVPGLVGSQLMLAVAVFLLSIVLADRAMEFRQRHEKAQEITEQSTADLQLEQRRRDLIEGLQEALRGAPPGDLQWIAFRRLLSTLSGLLPNEGIALVAFGYHQLDLLLAEPGDRSDRFKQLLGERGGNIKGICRGRTPMQLRFTESDKVIVEPGQTPPEEQVCGRFAVVPLEIGKPGWGGVIIESEGDTQYSNADLRRVAELSTIAIEITDEAVSQLDLRRRAEIDSLTGAFNRRAGEAMLEALFERAQQGRLPLSALFLDIDHFKRINDEYGHPVGDECLRLVAECLRRQLRGEDVVSRYGGEEFLVLLPGQSQDQARKIAERIREASAALRVKHESGLVKFTVSIGVAARKGDEGAAAELIERADRAMYQAKRNGRNRVQLASTTPSGGDFDPGDLIL